MTRSLRKQQKSYRDALLKKSDARQEVRHSPGLTEEVISSMLTDPGTHEVLHKIMMLLFQHFNNKPPTITPITPPAVSNSEELPELPMVSSPQSTPKRKKDLSPNHRTPVPKKTKPDAPVQLQCPKGCGLTTLHPGALSTHVKACTGEPLALQKKKKEQASRSKRQEQEKALLAADQAQLHFKVVPTPSKQ
jgi:hypothetical protein